MFGLQGSDSLISALGAFFIPLFQCHSGRHNCYLSWSEEKQLIESFKNKAVKGHIATAREIKDAYEEKVGHQVHKTTIYRLLDRHQWHKIVPRPSHPQEDPQAQEEFKKTLLSL